MTEDKATRKRYCDIQATSLEEVLRTCERHMRNCHLMLADCFDCEDCSKDYIWLIEQMREMWADLHEDVTKMLAKEKNA